MNPPKTAYVLLWFPKPSETFVFREVANLMKMGLPLKVFTLYGKLSRGLSPEMQFASKSVERLGTPYLRKVYKDMLYWWRRDRKGVMGLIRSLMVKRWYGFEKTGENLWAFLCALGLARRFKEEGIEHIHAPWASGPATAAWISSKLTDIPFSFTARAWDIYPPDGVLREKIRDAALVRSETKCNISYLSQFTEGDTRKIQLTYNAVPLKNHTKAPVIMAPQYKLLAIGRFVGKKGYKYLIMACKILSDSGLDFHLTLAGDGPKGSNLKHLTRSLGITDRISFPGFITYDRISNLFHSADIFLMPSVVHSSGDRDGIPTVIMEALFHRVPVIACDVSGISEVIESGCTGLLIPEKDPLAIARAVLTLLGDRVSAIQMAERGYARALEMFSPEKNHLEVYQLYEKYFSPAEQIHA